MSVDDVWPICCVINALQSSVRNEILVEKNEETVLVPLEQHIN